MIHSFETEDAGKYGLAPAVVLNLFRVWIAYNRANQKNQREGKTWTYNSIKAWREHVPYLSTKQVRTAIEYLCAEGVLIKGNFNETPYDRTLWYALAEGEKPICQNGQNVVPVEQSSFATADKSLVPMGVPKEVPKQTEEIPPIPLLLNTPAFAEAWSDWLVYRKERKMKVTATTAKVQFQKLEAWGVEKAVQAIRDSISNNWQGFFEPRTATNGAPTPKMGTGYGRLGLAPMR